MNHFDPRRQTRRIILKALYEKEFNPAQSVSQIIKRLTKLSALSSYSKEKLNELKNIPEKQKELDQIIQKHASTRPLAQLFKIDLAILRLATYEIYFTDTPEKAVINEAVELAKEFGSESSSSFINGTLGSIFEEYQKNKTPQENKSEN